MRSGRMSTLSLQGAQIKDWSNDPVKGMFYSAELQKVELKDPNPEYKIEKIIKRRTRNKVKEVLVKWLGWHRKFNSWIPESEVKDI